MVNRTTDELIELVAWCNDRIAYKRRCNIRNTSEEETVRYNAVSELITRGVEPDFPGSPRIAVMFI